MLMGLSERLRELHIKKKLTQVELSERLGVSKAVISSYETADRSPSYTVLIKMARLYGVSTDYILGVDQRRMIDISDLNPLQVDAIEAVLKSWRED